MKIPLIRNYPMPFPPFKGILAFDAVVRLGSVSKAAAELNLTVSAVSHQLANLEAFVGRRLLERSPRGVTLTVHGERFQRDMAGALTLLSAAAQHVRSGETAEVLRIHSVPSFASLWLMPRLPTFRALYPELRVHLEASYGDVDFSRGLVDVDVRYGAIQEGRELHIESVFSEDILPMISPRLKATLAIREPQDLANKELIQSKLTLVQWPHWFAANGVAVSPSDYVLSFDRTSMVLEAAIQGLGIALDSHRSAEGALRRGDLVPVFDDRKAMPVRAHHLVYPRAHARWDRVEKFTSWLRAEVSKS
ncbi:LysR substrate-binding domain-containing protein [Piscinibacter sp.]|uniref:LysR substrate-binding domain-containing protein n=1 Tax=Piscinibacter sp. TaxID=1903157 RepID=UPI0039E70C81